MPHLTEDIQDHHHMLRDESDMILNIYAKGLVLCLYLHQDVSLHVLSLKVKGKKERKENNGKSGKLKGIKRREKEKELFKGKFHLAQWLIGIMIPCPPLHTTNR